MNNNQQAWSLAASGAILLIAICCAALPVLVGGLGMVTAGLIKNSPWLWVIGAIAVALAIVGFVAMRRQSHQV